MESPALVEQTSAFMNIIGIEDDDSDDDSTSPLKSKKQGEVAEKPKKKQKKKTNQLDLEVVRDKSRNAQTNVIKVDKKNKTVGKLMKQDNVADMSKSFAGLLAESLHKQGFVSVQEKKTGLLGQDDYDELNQPSHVVEY